MPLTLLLALILAFGIRLNGPPDPFARGDLIWLALAPLALIGLLGAFALILVRTIRGRRSSPERNVQRARKNLTRASRILDWLSLFLFALIIHGLDWPAVVETGFGLGGMFLIDEFLILLPFLLAQIVCWIGLYPLERDLRALRTNPTARLSLGHFLGRRARQSFGLILPAALLYALAFEIVNRCWPAARESAFLQLVVMTLLGGSILILAPALIRIAWPTRPLAAGPLRSRLERLARRLNFQCTDILVWDTERSLINAGVTGALPNFRYVLLTDALIESLDDRQIEAVFGHEVGHVVHRHLTFFGFFCVGSMGILSLVSEAIAWVGNLVPAHGIYATAWTATQAILVLACLGLYFFMVFGMLSRRFERQADVFGCRAVSCGRVDCPPHGECEGSPGRKSLTPAGLCPVGIRTFASALADVASLNGMEPEARSWRHGSIRWRIAFLERLEAHPELEPQFQVGVRRLRIGLTLGLLCALAVAAATGALENL